MDKERLTLAYHEAGHGVMAWLCGLPIQYLKIGDEARKDYTSAGQTMLDTEQAAITDEEYGQLAFGSITPTLRAKVEGWIMVYASGALAQQRFSGHTGESMYDDLRQMTNLCKVLANAEIMDETLAKVRAHEDVSTGPEAEEQMKRETEKRSRQHFDALGFKARAILYDPANWKAVATVAESLCRRHYLTGKQIDRIIASAAPQAKRLKQAE